MSENGLSSSPCPSLQFEQICYICVSYFGYHRFPPFHLLPQSDYWPRQIFLDVNHFLKTSIFLFLYCLYQVVWSGKQTILGGRYLIEKIRHNTVGRLRRGRSEERVSGIWEIKKCRNHREVVTAVLKHFLRALPSLQILAHLERPLKLCEIYFCAFRCCVCLGALCGCGGILDEGQAICARKWLPQEQPLAPKEQQLPCRKWENHEMRSR